ncbi:hypothetical protein L7F22_023433 [Adiantum nelumboides]|nr:hypothetical protein [Adiantum nelumboides]
MASVSNATATHGAPLARVLSSRVQLLLHKSYFSKSTLSPPGLAFKKLHANLTMSVIKGQPFTSISHRQPGLAFASLGQAGPVANFASEIAQKLGSQKEMDPVVSPEWLYSRLSDPNIKVIDASWYMPGDNRNPFQEYKACHIPKALFFDVDGVVDPTSNLPHMLPTEDAFAAAVSALGIKNTDTLIIYDGKGIFSAARVWWMFQTFGHQNVFSSEVVKKVYQGQQVGATSFKAKLQPDFVWSLDQVKANIEDAKRVLVDARSKARFDGLAPEPRKGIRGGHVPGSKCVPFIEVLKDGAMLLEKEELRSKFDKAGVSLISPIVASCGTGVTACVLALALHRLGKNDVAVYDGSWTEWGGLPDTPIQTSSE